MYKAVVLLYPQALATSATLPAEILGAAAQLSRASDRIPRPAEVRLLSANAIDKTKPSPSPSVNLSSGLTLQVDGDYRDLASCDLLILPAIWRHPRRVLTHHTHLLPLLRKSYDQGADLCSVGSASSLLAEAGLLNGHPATTHWHDFERFARAYPDVDLKRRHLMTHSERLYCVGSVNSIADFMVHKLGQWYGARIARAVEAQFSPEARQSFETAAFLQQSPGTHHDEVIRDIQDFLQQNLAEPHSLGSLAAMSGLSERSLGRRFRQATGEAPMAYLAGLRIREARALLQHSDLSIAEIAWSAGYSSPSRFSQAFRNATALTPRQYRSAVRGKRFTDAGARELPTTP